MHSYPVAKARAEFSKLVDKALAGEPQRVTRHGKEAVLIVSEVEWAKRQSSVRTLADLMLQTLGSDDLVPERGSALVAGDDRPLGSDFAD